MIVTFEGSEFKRCMETAGKMVDAVGARATLHHVRVRLYDTG